MATWVFPEDLDQVIVLGRRDGLEGLAGILEFAPDLAAGDGHFLHPVGLDIAHELAEIDLSLDRLGDWRRLQRRMMITPAEIQKRTFFMFLFLLRGIIFFLLSGPF